MIICLLLDLLNFIIKVKVMKIEDLNNVFVLIDLEGREV